MTTPTVAVAVRRIYYASGSPSVIEPVYYDDQYDSNQNVDVLDPVLQYNGQISVDGFTFNGIRQEAGGGDSIGDALRADAIAYWTMDESSGTRSDSTGNGHNLAPIGTVTGVVGKIEKAIQTSLADENSIRVTNDSSFNTNNKAVAIAFWVNFNTVSVGNDQTLIWRQANNGILDFYIAFNSLSGGLWIDVYEGNVVTNNEIAFLQSSVTITASTWFFVVAELDRINEIVKIRINSTQNQDAFFDTGIGTTGNASIFSVGAEVNALAPNVAQHQAEAKIDELGWWDRLLTTEEKDYLYNSGIGIGLFD